MLSPPGLLLLLLLLLTPILLDGHVFGQKSIVFGHGVLVRGVGTKPLVGLLFERLVLGRRYSKKTNLVILLTYASSRTRIPLARRMFEHLKSKSISHFTGYPLHLAPPPPFVMMRSLCDGCHVAVLAASFSDPPPPCVGMIPRRLFCLVYLISRRSTAIHALCAPAPLP